MRRRSRASGKLAKGRSRKAKTLKAARHRSSSASGQETEVARFRRERDEALLRETANTEILRLISSSPGDLELVFRTILEDATRICNANFGTLFRFDGENLYPAAQFNTSAALLEAQLRRGPFKPTPGTAMEHVVRTKQVSHSADKAAEPVPGFFAEHGGARTQVIVPMLRDDALIGAITIYRQEVRPFTEKQIDLVKNFAAQAVIAIENARLLNELRQRTDDLTESLEQQTATSKVLSVISSSAGELGPVFQSLLENATRLCSAKFGNLYLREDDALRTVAMHNVPPAFAEVRNRDPLVRPVPGGVVSRMVNTKTVVQNPDMTADQGYIDRNPQYATAIELGGFRAILAAPMLKEAELVGAIVIYRQEAGPFTEKQIELLTNFAAQAVIAIENARLLNELRESLQQQTASADVLRIISSSPGELQPVFESMLCNAVRLCDAKFGNLWLREGEAFRAVSLHNAPPAYAELRRREPIVRPGPETVMGRMAATKQACQTADVQKSQGYADRDPLAVVTVEVAGARTFVSVPMLRENELIGAINIYRQEVRPFTDRQIELVQNFAAQAVIAIENARLLNELRESLDRQTATADILRVIAGTPEDSKRALDTIAETASRMFDAANVNFRRLEENVIRIVSSAGPTVSKIRQVLPALPLDPTDPAVRSLLDNRQIPFEDRQASLPNEDSEIARALRDLPVRSQVFTPLSREGKAIGVMIVSRSEVRPFQEGELEMMKGFADQAVIAIENARLLSELRESLEQQTATADVLGIISSSPNELRPIFDSILENATRLCEAQFGNMFLREGNGFRTVAIHSPPSAYTEWYERHPFVDDLKDRPQGTLARLAESREILHVPDLRLDPSYAARVPAIVALVDGAGARKRRWLSCATPVFSRRFGAVCVR
jgi:GAF domain-containing protein